MNSRLRRQQRRDRARQRAIDPIRDLVIVAAAVEGHSLAHPGLKAELIESDEPLVAGVHRMNVLTHDESGEAD